MIELKFLQSRETQRQESETTDAPFEGQYKFSTQNTCVCEEFVLIFTENESMKINVKCNKAFYNNGKIGLLKKDNNEYQLEIYKNCNLIDTINLHDINEEQIKNLRDLSLDGTEMNTIKENTILFVINNNKMIVTPEEISINGNKCKNTINYENCIYFVAYYDNLTILGNNKSFEFMYFSEDKPKKVDEFHPLALRIDENTLDEVYLEDIKFYGSELLLIDSDIVRAFKIEEFNIDKVDRVCNEYEIKDKKLIKLANKDNKEVHIKNTLQDKQIDIKDITTKTKDENEMFKTNLNNFKTDILKNIKDNSNNLIEETGKNDKSTVSSIVPDEKEKKIAPELAAFDADIKKRVETLKNGFKKIGNKKVELPVLKCFDAKFDCSGLYELIFHNRFLDYEEALSSMILRAEQMACINENEVKESIKYFDSKIIERHEVHRSLKYINALCSRFNDVVKLSNPVDDILEGIKILEIKQEKSNTEFKDSKENKDKSQNIPVSVSENKNKTTNLPDVEQNQQKLVTVIEQPVPVVPAPVQSTQSLFTSPIPYNISPVINTQAANTTNPILFSNAPSIANSYVVSDTSSLFNSLAADSTGSNMISGQQGNQPTTQQQNEEKSSSSAFNRLSGSRKMFQ